MQHSVSPFSQSATPDFAFETQIRNEGYQIVCGVDEAGRGPLAGPVTAAAVILDPDNIPAGLNDSKKLSEARREELFGKILDTSTVSIASVGALTIDRINIRSASLLAMQQAVRSLSISAQFALIDGNALPPKLPCAGKALVKGDTRCLSIAAASIVAKVSRDRLMARAHCHYPAYGLSGHKGYPTAEHRNTVMQFGPCNLHRKTFRPVAAALTINTTKNPVA